MPDEPGPRRPTGADLGVAQGLRRSGLLGALDLGLALRQVAGLVLVLAVVLVVLPGLSTSAHASELRLYLHNYPTPPSGETPAGRGLPMNGTAPTSSTLYDYATDHSSNRDGRLVQNGSTDPAEPNLRYMTNWVYQVPEDMMLSGNAVGGIWIAQKDGCDKTGTFHLFLRKKATATGDSGTTLASGSGTIPAFGDSAPCEFGVQGVTLPVATTLEAGTFLELKLTISNGAQPAAIVAYDTTSFASYLDLPLADPPTPSPEPPTPTPEPATPTPEPATPTPEPATPTPEPATPTPEPATPTPDPSTPTPEAVTPTPEPATPTPTEPPPTEKPEPPPPTPTEPPPTEKPARTPLEPTPTPIATVQPTDPPPPPPPPTPTPTAPPPTPTPDPPTPTPTATPRPTEAPEPIPSFLPPVRPPDGPGPLTEVGTPPPLPESTEPPQPATPTPSFATPPPGVGPLAPVATPDPRPDADFDDRTEDQNERPGEGAPAGQVETPHQLVDLTGDGTAIPVDSVEPGGDDAPNVLAASISNLARTAGEAVKTFAFPLSLTVLVVIFLLIQGEIDRRDPKLAFAPIDSSKDMVHFE